MKKPLILMSVLLFLIAGAVHGQVTQTNTQFPNPGFEKWSRHGSASCDGNDTTQKWVPFNWHTFDEASCSLWVGCGSARTNHQSSVNYNNGTMQQFGGTGTNSTKYIGIKCTSLLGIKANGALSTGQTEVGSMTATNSANYNYTNTGQSSSYSTSGNLSWAFVGCPDSMAFYYYTSMTNSEVQPLFKVFLHESGEFRDRADGSLYGANNVRLIASSVDTFSQSASWKREAWPFKYTKPGKNNNDSYTFIGQTDRPTHSTYGYYTSLNRPTYMLASFSTDKKAGNSNQTSGDLLFIDELWCIYDKGLSSLTIAGTDYTSTLNLFNVAEGLTHKPVRTYDNNGNPIFDNSGSATWMYPAAISCNNIPQVMATPKSKLITEFTITQASAENGYKATIYVKHNDNSTFHYYIQFTPELPTITLNQADGMYTACAGEDIPVTASGAATYNWSYNLGNTATVYPTVSGTYTVTGTAANGCTGTATATVNVLPAPATPEVVTISNNRCVAPFNGSISVTSPVGQQYTYSIDGTTFQAENLFDNLEPNEYTVTVRNIEGCQSILNSIVVNNVAEPVETEIIVNNAIGSYEWNGTTYTESGDYSTTFTAANGCDSIVTLHLTMACLRIETVPYTENFDSFTNSTVAATGVEPTCWELVQEDATMTDANRPQIYYKSDYAHSGKYSLLMNYRGVYAMPALSAESNIPLNQVKLEMYLRQPKAYYQLQVGVWEDNGNFVPVATFNNSGTGVTRVECDFSGYNGNGRRIAFRNVLANGYNYNYSYNYIDDVTLTEIPQIDCDITLPYSENFDNFTSSGTAYTGVEPTCWELVQEDATMTDANRPQIYYKGDYAHSGKYSLLMNYRGVYAMPALSAESNIPLNQVKLEMYLRQPKAYYQLQVGVWEDNGNFVPVATFNNSGTGVTRVECDFSGYNGNGRRIAFRNVLANGYNYNYSYNYIDDVTLTEIPQIDCDITLPYSENFDNFTSSGTAYTGVEPTCWELVQEDATMTDANRPQIYYKGDYAHSGKYSLLMNYRGVYAMPALSAESNIPLNQVKLEMYLRQPKAYYQLQVGVWEDNGNFVPVATFNNSGTGVTHVECDFSGYNGNGRRIAFRNVLANGYNYNYSYNYIDDVTLTEIPQMNCDITLPYNENFDNFTDITTPETGVKPDCWDVITEDVALTGATKPQVYYNATYATSGSYTLRMKNRCVFAMPALDESINVSGLTMTFKLRQPKSVYRLQVGVVNDNGVFEAVKTINNASTNMEDITVDFSNYAGGGHRIAFRNTVSKSSTLDYSVNYIDDINLDFTVVGKSVANDDNIIDANTDLIDFVVYPNPTKDVINVQGSNVNAQCSGIEVVDVYGKVVRTVDQIPAQINVSGLAAGMYFVRVTTDNGVVTKPFVKQ